MECYFELTFGTSLDKNVKVRIPKADPDPDVADVRRSMNKIKNANPLLPKYGTITSKEKAVLVSVETVPFNVK